MNRTGFKKAEEKFEMVWLRDADDKEKALLKPGNFHTDKLACLCMARPAHTFI